MIYKSQSKNKFKKISFYEMFKVAKALAREGFYYQFCIYFFKSLRIMSLPDHIINLASQLSEDQMYSLQTNLRSISQNDRLNKFKKIEEILTDYDLPVESLSKSQIIGFAKFVSEN